MNSKVSVLAAIAFSLALSTPSFAQTDGSGGNDSGGSGSVGASDTGTQTGSGNDQSGTATTGVSGAPASDVTGTAAPGAGTLDTDGNGTVSLDEFNTGIEGQDDAARQQTLNGLTDEQIEQLRGECEGGNASDPKTATCGGIQSFKRM